MSHIAGPDRQYKQAINNSTLGGSMIMTMKIKSAASITTNGTRPRKLNPLKLVYRTLDTIRSPTITVRTATSTDTSYGGTASCHSHTVVANIAAAGGLASPTKYRLSTVST